MYDVHFMFPAALPCLFCPSSGMAALLSNDFPTRCCSCLELSSRLSVAKNVPKVTPRLLRVKTGSRAAAVRGAAGSWGYGRAACRSSCKDFDRHQSNDFVHEVRKVSVCKLLTFRALPSYNHLHVCKAEVMESFLLLWVSVSALCERMSSFYIEFGGAFSISVDIVESSMSM